MCNKAIPKYIRRVKRVYHGNRDIKKRFIDDLQDSLLCFAEECPDCSYTDLVDRFGSPYEIRESFLGAYSKELKKHNIILYRFVILCSVLIMIAALTFTIYKVMNNYEYSQGYFIKSFTDENHPEPSPKPGRQSPIVKYIFD